MSPLQWGISAMQPLPTGLALVAAGALSQILTLLFIGVIGRVLRRKARGPLGARSPRSCAKVLRAGTLSGSVRYWTVASVIAGLTLLSPVVAFLMIIATEVLIDALMEAGTTVVSAIAIGAVGWVLFRRFWQPSDRAVHSGPGVLSDETAIAAPPL